MVKFLVRVNYRTCSECLIIQRDFNIMAPKCSNSKFTLIYWINSPYKDIIRTTTIPKSRRLVGEIIKLKWQGATGKSERKDAKIIAFSGK